MRILFLCQFFTPDITAAAFRMSDFAYLLAQAGDEVRVITSHPHKAHVGQVDDAPFEETGIRIYRCRLREVDGPGTRAYLRHYLSYLRGSVRLGVRIWREGWRPDVIYASSPPLFVGIAGRILSMLFRRPMVFEVRDIWPDAAVSAGQLSPGGRAYQLGKRLERYIYRRASHITCVAQPMRDYLIQQTTRPVTVVYNGIAAASVAVPAPERDTAERRAPRVLLYAGNLGHVQQIDLMLEAVAQLAADHAFGDWHVHLLGSGAQMENLRNLTRKLDLGDRIRFLPVVARDEAYRTMHRADALYLHLMQDETMARTIPSKLFDYLLMARPIVAGLAGEGRIILEKTGANVVFQPGDITSLKDALRQISADYDRLDRHASANRELVLQHFTREQALRALRNVFQSLVG